MRLCYLVFFCFGRFFFVVLFCVEVFEGGGEDEVDGDGFIGVCL